MRLFFDIDVTFDVLTKRKPWYQESATVLSLIESDRFTGIVAAHSITTLFYLSAKTLGHRRATAALVELLNLVEVAPLDQTTILKAAALGWSDLEDAIQMLSASNSNADYLVTRNTGDFKSASIPVVTPRELLAILRA